MYEVWLDKDGEKYTMLANQLEYLTAHYMCLNLNVDEEQRPLSVQYSAQIYRTSDGARMR